MSHALLFGDLHVHNHKKSQTRLQDCLEVLDWIFKTAVDRKIPNILFGGDLLHERQKIDVLNYIRVFEKFIQYSNNNFEIYLLIGNHDMYHRERWDVNSVKPLSAIPCVHVIAEPTTINIDGHDIDFLPFTEDPITDLKKLKGNRKNGDILIAHAAVDGAQLNTMYGIQSDVVVEYDSEMTKVSPDIFKDWKQTFLSHYHAAQELTNGVEYIGSPLELSFGEAFQKKHIIDFDLETRKKDYINNDFSPKHLILKQKDIDKHVIRETDFVRIIVDDISSTELVDIRKELVSKYNMASLDIKMREKDQKEIEQEKELLEAAKDILFETDEMVEKWIDFKGTEGLDKNKLTVWGKEICQKEKIEI